MAPCLLATIFLILPIAIRILPIPKLMGAGHFDKIFAGMLLEILCLGSTFFVLANMRSFTPALPEAKKGAMRMFLYGVASLQSVLLFSTVMNVPFSIRSAHALINYEGAKVTALGGIVLIDGIIGPSTLTDLLSIDKTQSIKTIKIRSNGGLIDEALAIADLVKSREISVHVIDYCASACTIVASASHFLTASPSSTFGFHRGATIIEYDSSLSRYLAQEATLEMVNALRENGIPPEILNAMLETPSDQMHYVSAERMRALGVLKAIHN